ncbi:unnamed protein product, partial [Prorocentrum cordatum]
MGGELRKLTEQDRSMVYHARKIKELEDASASAAPQQHPPSLADASFDRVPDGIILRVCVEAIVPRDTVLQLLTSYLVEFGTAAERFEFKGPQVAGQVTAQCKDQLGVAGRLVLRVLGSLRLNDSWVAFAVPLPTRGTARLHISADKPRRRVSTWTACKRAEACLEHANPGEACADRERGVIMYQDLEICRLEPT